MKFKVRLLAMTNWMLFLLILSAGTFLRFHALDRQSLWNDEMSTLRDISMPFSAWTDRFQTYEMHPPLYFLQLRVWSHHLARREAPQDQRPPWATSQVVGWRVFWGAPLAVLRSNSAFWGSLGLAAIYFLASLYVGPSWGLAAMAVMALSPYHLAYSQEMRPYAQAITLTIVSLLLLQRVLTLYKPLSPDGRCSDRTMGEGGAAAEQGEGEGPHPAPSPVSVPSQARDKWQWLGLTIAWTALLYTHYWGSFVVLAQWIYGLAYAKTSAMRKGILAAGCISIGLFSFWWPVVFHQMRALGDLAFWVPPPAPANLFKPLIAFAGLYFPFASSDFIAMGALALNIVVGLAYAMVLIVGVKRGAVAARPERGSPSAARLWIVLGLGLPYILSYCQRGIYVWYRYPILVYPAFILIALDGVKALPSRIGRGVLLGLFIASGAAGCWKYFTVWEKANPKAVVSYIDNMLTQNAVVVRPSYFADLFSFYHQGRALIIDEDKLGSPAKRAALKGRTIFLAAFDVPSDPVGEALRSDFRVVSKKYFPGFARLGVTVYELR